LSSQLASFKLDLDEVETAASATFALANVDSALLHRTASGIRMFVAELAQLNATAQETAKGALEHCRLADLEAAALRKEIAELQQTVAEMAECAQLNSASASLAAATAAEALQACDAVRRKVVEEMIKLQAEAADSTMALDLAERTAGMVMEEREREAAGLRMALAAAEGMANEGIKAQAEQVQHEMEMEVLLLQFKAETARTCYQGLHKVCLAYRIRNLFFKRIQSKYNIST
jgi:uncharacterized membrane protein YheB (UPF0754 family)